MQVNGDFGAPIARRASALRGELLRRDVPLECARSRACRSPELARLEEAHWIGAASIAPTTSLTIAARSRSPCRFSSLPVGPIPSLHDSALQALQSLVLAQADVRAGRCATPRTARAIETGARAIRAWVAVGREERTEATLVRRRGTALRARVRRQTRRSRWAAWHGGAPGAQLHHAREHGYRRRRNGRPPARGLRAAAVEPVMLASLDERRV